MAITTRPALAHALAGFSGLDYHVALNWLNAENSVAGNGTNPLGILCGNSSGSGLEIGCAGRFAVYRSSIDGVKAAAWLLAHGSHYGEVRTAIAGGTPAAQRAAIVSSGWATGDYHGGSSFSPAGITGSAPSAGPTAILTSAPKLAAAAAVVGARSSGGGTFAAESTDAAKLRAGLVAAGISTDPAHVLTAAEAVALTRKIYPLWRGGALFDAGQTVGDLLKMTTVGTQAGQAAQNVFDVLTFKWVPGFAINLAILATILILGYRGIREILG